MDARTRQILKDARHAILWLCNPQLRYAGESERLPRTDIVEAIDAILDVPPSLVNHKDYCTKDRCYCGSQ
jgi:hypothetical protein